MSLIPNPITVEIPPGQTIGPVSYQDGYVVIPMVTASLIRVSRSKDNLFRQELNLVERQPYCHTPEPGSEISIENVGDKLVSFQKLVKYCCPIPSQPQPPILPRQPIVISDQAGGKRGKFDVEVATTLAQQTVGLIGRTVVPANEGMMMDLKTPRKTAIWMYNTLVSLDVLFLDDTGAITSVATNLTPNDPTPVSSGVPVRAVVELAAGTVTAVGAMVGDVVSGALFP